MDQLDGDGASTTPRGADKESGNLVKSAKEKLKHLTTLTGEIGKEFSARVSKRAGVAREKA